MKTTHTYKRLEVKLTGKPTHFIPDKERRQWTRALRSGKYKQVKNRLHAPIGFCCLGVKRDLEGCKWEKVQGCFMDSEHDTLAYYKGECYALSEEGEFDSFATCNFEGGKKYRLATLNDEGATFDEIAWLIDLLWNPRTYRK